MKTLEKPILQETNTVSLSPLFEELSDESAASCSGGNNVLLPFLIGYQNHRWRLDHWVPVWSANLNTAANLAQHYRNIYRVPVDYVGPELR
jgi:hypothetical protein